MNVKTNYHPGTNTVGVRIEYAPGVTAYASTVGTVGVEMSPEKWLEVWAAVRKKIDDIQLAENKQEIGGLTADLAAKIEQHGAAS